MYAKQKGLMIKQNKVLLYMIADTILRMTIPEVLCYLIVNRWSYLCAKYNSITRIPPRAEFVKNRDKLAFQHSGLLAHMKNQATHKESPTRVSQLIT